MVFYASASHFSSSTINLPPPPAYPIPDANPILLASIHRNSFIHPPRSFDRGRPFSTQPLLSRLSPLPLSFTRWRCEDAVPARGLVRPPANGVAGAKRRCVQQLLGERRVPRDPQVGLGRQAARDRGGRRRQDELPDQRALEEVHMEAAEERG